MPPERSSSNDLLLEQLSELLQERQRDLYDGISARALHRDFKQHAARDELLFSGVEDRMRNFRNELEARIRDLEAQVARSEGRVEGTGRFNIPPVAINVDPRGRSKRPSAIPSVASVLSVVKNPAVQWIAIALVAASHFLTRCGLPPVVSPPPTAQH